MELLEQQIVVVVEVALERIVQVNQMELVVLVDQVSLLFDTLQMVKLTLH
jgi:hypothetical protein